MFIKDKLYREIIDKTIIQTIDIVFLNDKNEILLGLRNNNPLKGVYYLPGGRRLKSETILESAKRKAKEEIGINIDTDKLIFLGVYDDIYENSMYKGIGSHYSPIIYIYKLNDIEAKNIKTDLQHNDLKFFNINDKNLCYMLSEKISDIKKLNIL
ncbi:MAG: NUDIX domain-containing protein [Candidatus Gracilibacteria bacterium]|nr:NUDIX domain-containing protein [Candidatus Gracilibacteria bacterium]